MSSRGRMSVLVSVAVGAMVFGSVGTAVAGPAAGLTKKQVQKVAAKVVKDAAPGLSVATAKSAGSATSADSARSADFAKNADKLDGVDAAGLLGVPGAIRLVAAAQVTNLGTTPQEVGSLSVSKFGVGLYDITWSGGSLSNEQVMCMVTSAGVSAQCGSIGDAARVSTYNAAGTLADGQFNVFFFKLG